MSDDLVKIRIDPENEAFPVLSISEDPDRGRVEVPRYLLDALWKAYGEVDSAEMAIMEFAAEKYPQYTGIREWVNDHRGA